MGFDKHLTIIDMKILQVTKCYYPYIGGIEQVTQDCAQALFGEHEMKILCFNHEKGDAYDEVEGVEVIRAGCFAKISSQMLSLSYKKLLKKTVASFQPDIIFFHYPNPFAAHYVLKVLKKHPECRLVLYWHADIIKQKFLGKFFAGQTKKLLERADQILATSPNYVEGSKFLRPYREKSCIASCCVNVDRTILNEESVAKAKAIREKNQGKTICFALGRHVPYKGMEYLIRASKLLDDSFRVYIAGEGPLTKSLQVLAQNDEKVVFLGRIGSNDLKAYLSACDIFCFPSITKNEAFGIALAEAMSFGKPAVTFTIEGSGVNYVSLNEVTGFEVENGNVVQYADAMKRLAEDKQLREKYGNAARERVEELFTQKIFENTIRLIVETVSKKERQE